MLPCDPKESSFIFYPKFVFVFENVLQLSGTITVTKALEPPLAAEIRLTRCSNLNALQCEHFNNFTVTQFCEEMNDNEIFSNQFQTKFNPSLQCPIEVGTYNLDGFEFKLDQFAALPVEGFRWTVNLDIIHAEEEDDYEIKKYLGCIRGQVRVLAYSSRKKV